MAEHWDYVVVGAGTAGCVLANRLTEDGKHRVLPFHPTSTCRMGEDARAVVDTRLRVRGLEGLRVIDASNMPAVVSGNTNAAVFALAEKGAELVRADADRA